MKRRKRRSRLMMGLSRWQFDSTNAAVARTPRLKKYSNCKRENIQMAFLDVKLWKNSDFHFSLVPLCFWYQLWLGKIESVTLFDQLRCKWGFQTAPKIAHDNENLSILVPSFHCLRVHFLFVMTNYGPKKQTWRWKLFHVGTKSSTRSDHNILSLHLGCQQWSPHHQQAGLSL